DALGFFIPPFAYANGQVLAQAVQAAGSLDQQRLGGHLHAHTFKTIVGGIPFSQNGERGTPPGLPVPVPGGRGNDLEQFKKAGTQVIVYPEPLASGRLIMPYAER